MEIAETYPFSLGFQMTDAYYLSIVSLVLSTLTVILNYHWVYMSEKTSPKVKRIVVYHNRIFALTSED